MAYYDVTNYYFEIDEEDELRRKGPSKEKRPNPIVQMSLLLDSKGLPLAFHLFPGNQSEKLSLNPIMNRVKEEYGLGRLVVVADKGLNCGDNIAYQIASGNGYVYSQSIRGADQEFKQYVLDQSGYQSNGEHSKCKSRIYPREITFTDSRGKKQSSVLIRSRLFSTVRIMRIKLNTNEMKMNQASLPAPSNKTENQKLTFSALELTNSIRNYTCSSLGENLYNFHYTDDVIQSLAKNNSRYLQINMLYLN